MFLTNFGVLCLQQLSFPVFQIFLKYGVRSTVLAMLLEGFTQMSQPLSPWLFPMFPSASARVLKSYRGIVWENLLIPSGDSFPSAACVGSDGTQIVAMPCLICKIPVIRVTRNPKYHCTYWLPSEGKEEETEKEEAFLSASAL